MEERNIADSIFHVIMLYVGLVKVVLWKMRSLSRKDLFEFFISNDGIFLPGALILHQETLLYNVSRDIPSFSYRKKSYNIL